MKTSLHHSLALLLLLPLSSFADPVVTDVVAKQRYPWNGKVDIACTVSGLDEGRWTFSVAAVDPDSGDSTTVSHVQVMRDGVASSDLKVQANGNHHLVWDASADLGEVVCSNMVVRVEVDKRKVQLWEGGPYWATENIGADEPWKYGLHFWWGDTVGYRREGGAWIASDDSSESFSFDSENVPTYGKDISTLQSEGWVVSKDGTYVLAPEHDAAHVNWGSAWRMPTYQELYDLCYNKCDWSWTTMNGVRGYVVRGRGDYASASIFLPVAGYGIGTSHNDAGSLGNLWSSVPDVDNSLYAWAIDFYSGRHRTYGSYRYCGQYVRPVQGFSETATTVGGAGDSASFSLGTTDGLLVADTIVITYDTSWIGGDPSAAAVISDNGIGVRRVTGTGEFTHTLSGTGRHELVFTTLLGGVAQEEVYHATVYKGKYTIHFDANGGEGAMADCEVGVNMPFDIPQCTFTKGGHFLLGWALTPDGEATLLDGDLACNIVAKAGDTVALYAVWHEGTGIGGKLLHRWSFNGDLTDSASGQDAVAVGNVTNDGHSYRLAGGSWGNSYINLGSDVLPKDGSAATIEIWATKHSFQRWGRIFDFGTGSGDSDYVCMAWSGQYESDCPFRIYGIGGNVSGLEPYDSNREYHFAMVFKPDANGTWNITAYKQDAGTGETLKSVALSSGNSGWSLANQGMQTCWLGHSRYSGDLDANASYNEVRVWRTALTESELASNAQNGPDDNIYNAYTVRFEANGGVGTMTNRVYSGGDTVTLPTLAFVRNGWTFMGWATEADGPVAYADEATIDGGLDAANGVTMTLYARWGKDSYSIHFDANGGQGTMANQTMWLGFPESLATNSFARERYIFAGWATAADGAVAYADGEEVSNQTAEDGSIVTLYAVWADSRVIFNANGGDGTMEPFLMFGGAEQTLPESTFTKDGHFLLGWALTPDGEATLLDGDSTADLAAQAGETVTLYAVWHEGNAATGGECTTGGNANWFVQTSDTHDGIAAARSGAIGHSQSTWLETTVTGSGTISFWWMVSSEGSCDYLRFYVDGSQKDGISGGRTSWTQKSFEISADGEHTIRWTYSKDGSVNSGSDCGWVGEVSWPNSDKPHKWVVGSASPQLDGFCPAYAVRFDANGGEGTMPKRVYAGGDNVTLPTQAFARDGWAFVGWATEPDGPVVYADCEAFEGGIDAANGATVTLYARWAQSQYAVHFNANGGEGTMADESLWLGIPGWLSSNAFTRTGYDFAGWVTTEGGEIAFADKALVTNLTETANGAADLYAVWSPHQYEVRFNRGTGTGSMPNQQLTYDAVANLTSNAFTRTGYTFAGWATEEGGAKVYDDGAEVLNLATNAGAIVDLYTTWTTNAYTVVFDVNGGTGTMVAQAFTYDAPQALTSNAFTRANRFFAGWATEEDGGVVYADGEEVANLTAEADGEVTLYAVWADSRIVFDANGGEGEMEPFFLFAGTEQTLTEGTFTKDGHYLLGWALTPDGEATLLNGDSTTDIVAAQGETVTLYAVWHEGNGSGRGLSVKYYDISSSGYSTWTQSEASMTNYFAAYTPTIETNSLDFGMGLATGHSHTSPLGSSDLRRIANFGMTALEVGECRFHGKYALPGTEYFAILMSGWLSIDQTGSYSFAAVADDYVVIYIDGVKMANSQWSTIASGSITLEAGLHSISIGYYEIGGGQGFTIQWKRPTDSSYSPIPQSVLSDGHTYAYAVRFDENGGEGAMEKRVYAAGDDVTIPAMAFTRDGWTFVGWATEPDGPVVYSDSETVEGGINAMNGETITLNARWAQSQYSVRFNVNGGEGTMADESFWLGIPDTLPTSTFTRTGYTFAGWATTEGGEIAFADKALVTNLTETANGAADLYAVWSPHQYEVRFNRGTGMGSMPNQQLTYDVTMNLPPNAFARRGYTFAGWATEEGGAKVYDDGAEVLNLAAGDGDVVDLHATWAANGTEVVFHPNGGTGRMANVVLEAEQTLPQCTFTKVGHFFLGWALTPNGEATLLDGDSTADIVAAQGETVTLYAVWHEGDFTSAYAVRFDANGGTGAMPQRVNARGDDVTLPLRTFVRDDWTFVGWATEPDGPVAYANGETVEGGIDATSGGTVTLYARWLPVSPVFTGWFSEHAGTYPAAAMGTWSAGVGDEASVGQDGLLAFSTSSANGLGYSPDAVEPEGTRTVISLSVRFCVGHGMQSLPEMQGAAPYGSLSAVDLSDDRGAAYYALDPVRGWVRLAGAVPDPSRLVEVEMEASFAGDAPTATYRVDGATLHEAADASRSAFPMPGTPTRMHELRISGNGTLGPFRGEWWNGGNDPEGRLGVHFDPNGGEGDVSEHEVAVGTALTISPPSRERAGYSLAGWATAPDGPVVVASGANLQISASQSGLTTLYAVWDPHPYEIRFNGGDGSGSMPNQQLTYDVATNLTPNAFARTGYTFSGWATEEGGAKVYDDGAEVLNLAAGEGDVVDLHATWAANGTEVVFNPNGGTGRMANVVLEAEQTLPQCTFTKVGHFLLGWALTPDGEATLLDGDSTADIMAAQGETVTLYAVWQEGNGRGLSVKYYDISSSGYSTWSASEVALTNYFAAYTPTIETDTLAYGETLDPGIAGIEQSSVNQFRSWGLNDLRFEVNGTTNRFHGKYANKNQENIAAYLSGEIEILNTGTYSFACIADDFEAIFIDGVRVCRSQWNTVGSGSVSLEKGVHSFSMGFHEGDSGHGFAVQWKKPGDSSWSPLPQSVLSGGGISPYAVRFDANGGVGTMPKRVYAGGDDVTLPTQAFVRDGWTFVGWATEAVGPVAYADGETVEGGIDAMNGETITLYARWAQSQYSVRFNANGGEGTMADESFWHGIPGWLSSNAFTRTGYDFAGWATAAEGAKVHDDGAEVLNLATDVDEIVDLFATWTPNFYTVAFDAMGREVSPATKAVTFDAAYGVLPEPRTTPMGYSFANWTFDGALVTAETICTQPSNHVLTASWMPNEYTVSFNANGGTVAPETKIVTFFEEYGTLPVPTFEWHAFKQWMMGGNAVTADSIVATAADHTLVADWNLGIGGGAWAYPDGDEPIVLGAPLLAPSGKVVVPSEIDGRPVVEIGAEAFAGNTAITSITIPASVTNVAEGAFAGCTGLKTVAVDSLRGDRFAAFLPELAETVERVVFLDGVTIIPDNFFEGCTALKSMDIAESVAEIGTNVFEACSALATTTLENGLEMYQGWCLGFAEDAGPASQIASLEIPEEYEDVTARPEGSPHHGVPYPVRGIAAGAFEGETGIATVSLPESLVFIGARAFANCTGLGSVTVPEGVAKIDRDAFRNCTRAQGLALPESLRVIADGAFANGTRLPSVSIPQGVEEIGGCAFSNCWRVTSVSIPQSVERVGDGAFADCENVAGAVVPLHVRPMAELFPAAYATMTDAWVAEMDGSLGELAPPEAEGGSPGGLAPPFETRQMVPGMFAGCAAVEAIALPEWVRNVPDGAFEGCAAISALTFPGSVTNLGARACASMAALESVTFPAALETIGEEAFDGDSGIVSLALPDDLLSIGERAFRGLSRLARADIPASVRKIGADAFAGCAAIRAVTLPGDAGTVADAFPDAYASIVSATVVAETDEDGAPGGRALPVLMSGLFEGCAALTRVELPQDLAEIGASAFSNCSGLAEVGIPSAVTNIGASAFANCSTLSSIALPKSLAVLQNGVFTGCSALAGITIPEGVGEIGGAIFDGCTLLRSVRFVGNAPNYATTGDGPYAGVPAGCVTYVPNGSTGWDGIASSQDLPRYWPAGTTYRIDWWDPNRLTVSFDLCDGTAPTEVGQVTGTSYVLPAEPTRQGATFGGWWTLPENGARVTASTQVTAIGDYTVYAHWTMNRYAVRFDANGGRGAAEPFEMTVGTAAALPPCPFTYVGHSFLGWATAPGGPVVYADGATVSDLAYANGASVTLYAVWTEREWTLPDYLDAPELVFGTEGGEWSCDREDFQVGGASLTSGELPPSDVAGKWTNTVLRTTVFGEGALSFWWKVSCEPEDPEYGDWFDYATFTVDGVEVARIAGESGWQKAECAVTGAGTHSLEWTFFRDDYDEDGADWDNALWVDGVEWTPAPVAVSFDAGGAAEGEAPAQVVKWAGYALVLPGPGTLADPPRVFAGWSDGENVYAEGETYVFGAADATLTAVWSAKTWTLGEAVDAPAMSFATGGNDVWAVDTAVGWTNGVSAKSGAVANGQSSWVETTVEGAGTLAFRWKVMGGIYRNNPFAYAKVEIDGMQAVLTHLTDGWEERTVTIEGTGTHTVRWTYLRTSARDCDGDCAYLDAVAWEPAEAETPWIAGDDGTAVEGDGTSGWVVRPSAGNTAVEVVVPQGTDPAIVTVEVGTAVETVKPNGAVVKVVKDGFDITPWLDLPAAGADGVIDMAEANVKQAVADESLAPSEGASFTMTGEGPVLTTAPTKPGLTYTLVEGETLETMSDGATTQGDGEAWTPALTVKDGASGFYRIKVGK